MHLCEEELKEVANQEVTPMIVKYVVTAEPGELQRLTNS